MDRYVLGSCIGRGNYGEVFAARRVGDKQACVVKRLRDTDPQQRGRVEEEARLLARLRHPNIVAYHEHFLDAEGALCLAMQHCAGGDLAQHLRAAEEAGRALPEAQVWAWLAQLAFALHFLHSQCVLHRDLKAQNVFVDRERVFLGDFGISKALEGAHALAETYIGTPYYMPPELFDDCAYSFPADMWALGCLVYELCNLRRPFDAQSLSALAAKVTRGAFPPLHARYSQQLRAVVEGLLARRAEARPAAAEVLAVPAVKRELRAYLARLRERSALGEEEGRSVAEQLRVLGLEGGLVPAPAGSEAVRESALSAQTALQRLQQRAAVLEARLQRALGAGPTAALLASPAAELPARLAASRGHLPAHLHLLEQLRFLRAEIASFQPL